jgi:hypothetical protein
MRNYGRTSEPLLKRHTAAPTIYLSDAMDMQEVAMQRWYWIVLAVGASFVVSVLFAAPLGDFIYDIYKELFGNPAPGIAAFLRASWPLVLVVVLFVVGVAASAKIHQHYRQCQEVVGQLSPLERKSIEPMALRVEEGHNPWVAAVYQ